MEDQELPPTEKLVKAYIKMRDARSVLSAEYETKDKEIKENKKILIFS